MLHVLPKDYDVRDAYRRHFADPRRRGLLRELLRATRLALREAERV